MVVIFALALAQSAISAPTKSKTWQLEEVGPGCRIIRDADQDVTLGAETWLTTTNVGLDIIAPKGQLPHGIGETDVILLPSNKTITLHYGEFRLADGRTRLIKMFPTKQILGDLSASEAILLASSTTRIEMRGFAKALSALQTCTTGILQRWGVDPALYIADKLARPVSSNNSNAASAFTSADYPREARAAKISGKVVLLLQGLPDGSISKCTAVISDDPLLNDGSCAIATKRLLLKQPTDDQGQPLASYAVFPITWSNP